MEAGMDVLIEKPLASRWPRPTNWFVLRERHGAHCAGRPSGTLQSRGAGDASADYAAHVFRGPPAERVYPALARCGRRARPDDSRSRHCAAFANSPVKEIRAVGLPILSGKVDIANVRLEFDSGMRGEFHRQPGLHRAGAQAAFFPARAICFSGLRPAGVLVFTVGKDDGRNAPR